MERVMQMEHLHTIRQQTLLATINEALNSLAEHENNRVSDANRVAAVNEEGDFDGELLGTYT